MQFTGANFKVTSNVWHEIKVEARGNQFKCFYDGQLKFPPKMTPLRMRGRSACGRKPIRSSISMTSR